MNRMKTLLLALTLTATGCVELPIKMETKPHPAEPPPLVPVERPPVTPDQVNDDNAPRVLSALRDELDRAADEPAPAPDKKP